MNNTLEIKTNNKTNKLILSNNKLAFIYKMLSGAYFLGGVICFYFLFDLNSKSGDLTLLFNGALNELETNFKITLVLFSFLLCAFIFSSVMKKHVQEKLLSFQRYKFDLHKKYLKNSNEINEINNKKINEHPLMKVKEKLDFTLEKLTTCRTNSECKWNEMYNNLSSYYKIKCSSPNFSELDSDIIKITKIRKKFYDKHNNDLKILRGYYSEKNDISLKRINLNYKESNNFIDQYYISKEKAPLIDDEYLLKVAGWAGIFGISYSMWEDFTTTGAVYDSLRSVNSNFEGLSDFEIWTETLWMSENSLVGLASLTKGAYFEDLVSNDTGGQLFEHFNNPDTDIIIDGIEYQLKATDSISYINSVDDNIPVIATSEVANITNAFDSGINNAEISSDVDVALNGLGFDSQDVIFDGICAGVGGLGLFATINGFNHAVDKYDEGSSAEEAIFEGLAVAVDGTFKAVLDTGDLVFKGLDKIGVISFLKRF